MSVPPPTSVLDAWNDPDLHELIWLNDLQNTELSRFQASISGGMVMVLSCKRSSAASRGRRVCIMQLSY